MRAILDAAVDAVITIDARGIIESANPATEKLFGYSPAELVGNNINMLMPAPFRTEHDGYLARYQLRFCLFFGRCQILYLSTLLYILNIRDQIQY